MKVVFFFNKVFIEFIGLLLLLSDFGFWPGGIWDLSSPTGVWNPATCTPPTRPSGRRTPNHRTTREVHVWKFLTRKFLTNTFYFSSSDRYIVVFCILIFFIYFWLCCPACGIFVPWPGFKLRCLTVREQSPNHWTTRALLHFGFDTYISSWFIKLVTYFTWQFDTFEL